VVPELLSGGSSTPALDLAVEGRALKGDVQGGEGETGGPRACDDVGGGGGFGSETASAAEARSDRSLLSATASDRQRPWRRFQLTVWWGCSTAEGLRRWCGRRAREARRR
jgi:hypothetical protein